MLQSLVCHVLQAGVLLSCLGMGYETLQSMYAFQRSIKKEFVVLKSMGITLVMLGLWHMQSVLHGVMEEDDVRALYLWLERLARNPHTEDEARSIVAGVHMPCWPFNLLQAAPCRQGR